jgi:hypothetical protein
MICSHSRSVTGANKSNHRTVTIVETVWLIQSNTSAVFLVGVFAKDGIRFLRAALLNPFVSREIQRTTNLSILTVDFIQRSLYISLHRRSQLL